DVRVELPAAERRLGQAAAPALLFLRHRRLADRDQSRHEALAHVETDRLRRYRDAGLRARLALLAHQPSRFRAAAVPLTTGALDTSRMSWPSSTIADQVGACARGVTSKKGT